MISFKQPRVLSWEGLDVPIDFPYLSAILQGPPTHDHDTFSLQHPHMELQRRAKIFAPFDALDGYSDAVQSKDVVYVDRIDLNEDGLAEDERMELARRLEILHRLTRSGHIARQNRIVITVAFFVPCMDENSFSFGIRGQYKTITGICWKVDSDETGTIMVGAESIPLSEIISIEASDVFEDERETTAP